MADIDSIILALDCRANDNDTLCTDCAYYIRENTPEYCDIQRAMRDAIDKMQEQSQIIMKQNETIANLLQRILEIEGYMTPYGKVKDIEAFVKGKEAKPQRYMEHDIFHIARCPNEECCGVMKPEWSFCPYCGTACKWDYELEEKVFSDWEKSVMKKKRWFGRNETE